MSNLLGYNFNISGKTGSLWFYFKATNFNAGIGRNNIKFFYYKTKLSRDSVAQPTPNDNDGILKNATVVVPLKYLSKFWRSLEMPLINCRFELKPNWLKYCVLVAAGANNAKVNFHNAVFTIEDTKLYAHVVTLSAKTMKNYQNSEQ